MGLGGYVPLGMYFEFHWDPKIMDLLGFREWEGQSLCSAKIQFLFHILPHLHQ